MRFACCAVLAVLPFCLQAAVVVPGHGNHLTPADEPSTGGNWAMAARIAHECIPDPDTAACLSAKVATALERAARMNNEVQLLPGLTVAKNAEDASPQRDSRALPTEEELRGQLQADAPDHTSKVADMVINSGIRFLQSRTLQFKLPQTNPEELTRSLEEGEYSETSFVRFISFVSAPSTNTRISSKRQFF